MTNFNGIMTLKNGINRSMREYEGDVVADFFCGSGTSLVVAKELGRKYIGCDINTRAVEISNKRLNDVCII